MDPTRRLPSSTQLPYSILAEWPQPSCRLFCIEESLLASVQRSYHSLTSNRTSLGDSSTIPEEIMTPLLGCVEGYIQSAKALALNDTLNTCKKEPLRPMDKTSALHQEVAQICAFSQALDFALQGKFTEADGVALDDYCPPVQKEVDGVESAVLGNNPPLAQDTQHHPSCTSQAVRATGFGCLVLGVAAAVSGCIANAFDDTSEPYGKGIAVGGVASFVLGLGMVTTQSRYEYCQTKSDPTYDIESPLTERQLLERVNEYFQRR